MALHRREGVASAGAGGEADGAAARVLDVAGRQVSPGWNEALSFSSAAAK